MKHWPFRAREKRFGVDAQTVIETSDGYWTEARVLNLSNGGCRVALTKPIEVGEEVRLEVEPLGYVSARVVWTCFEGAGLVFTASLNPSDKI